MLHSIFKMQVTRTSTLTVLYTSTTTTTTIHVPMHVPGFAAAQREQAKFDADRASSHPVSRMHGGAHTLVPFVLEDGGR